MSYEQLTWRDLVNKDDRIVKRISYAETKPFILGIHYARRMPNVKYAFGMFEGGYV